MMTVVEASMRLEEIIAARAAAGLRHDRVHIDPVLVESGDQIVAYISFIGSDDDPTVYLSISLPAPIAQKDFDGQAFAEALLSPSRTIH
jgi:hypothetical protein